MNVSKGGTLFFLLLMPLIMVVTDSTLLVYADYDTIVEVSSPIQNKTYFTNDITLSFSYTTNIINSSDIGEYSVVFAYNLDGEPIWTPPWGMHVSGGKSTRIGQFYQPVPLDYTMSIDVQNGNHTLFVIITFWIEPHGEHPNTLKVKDVSQIVNFTVSSETPTPTPTTTLELTQQPSASPEHTQSPPTTAEPTQQPSTFSDSIPLLISAVVIDAAAVTAAYVWKRHKPYS
jgi:hypothetical protein